MYQCGNCSSVFDNPIHRLDIETGVYTECPSCHDSEDIYMVNECSECGKIEDVDDMPLFCGMCRDCFEKSYTDKIGYRYFSDLSKEEKEKALIFIYDLPITFITDDIARALSNDFKSEYSNSCESCYCDFPLSAGLKEFCFEDISDFSDWCAGARVFNK